MNEFFGISMNYIMIALLVVLFVALSTVIYIIARNRVMFLVGVRNIPRRRAQTILIIVGLMLSTTIISTALSIGDTVDYSVTNTAFNQLHSIDQIVSTRGNIAPDGEAGDDEDSDPFEGLGSVISPLPIPQDTADEFRATFLDVDNVDGAIQVVRGPAPVTNVSKGQSESFSIVVGIPPDQLQGFESDFTLLNGERVSPASLAEDEIFASESAAKKLDIEPGDDLRFVAGGQEHRFRVKGVVNDRILTGALGGDTFGFMLSFDRVAEMFGRTGDVDFIAVSNAGGVRDSLKHSEQVTRDLNKLLEGQPWSARESKANFVQIADDASSQFTTFFVVLGLFSIAAGMLLIFLIFVMLAAERKVEMGMIRAIGTQRRHLVQIFMSEGMIYNLVAAAVGCALGIGVSVIMVGVMARLFADFGLQITFNVTPRSLIISYSIGVVLTFLTVTFSSIRIGNLNIVSAIRDLPDPPKQEPRPRGGVLSYLRWLVIKPTSWRGWGRALGMIVLGATAMGAMFGLFMASGAVYDDNFLAGTAAILLAVAGGAMAVLGAGLLFYGFVSIFQVGVLAMIAGPFLIVLGYSGGQAFPFGVGLSMLIIGGAVTLDYIGLSARPVYTAMGLLMLTFWLLFAGNNVPGIKELDGDIEMFFLSGVTMVVAATFVLVYNADLMLAVLSLTGNVFSSLVPALKTAVAYPLANKFRTGMTIAMISLVMFALVMFSTMNANFDRLFLSDDALGGYEVVASENPGNPIDDLQVALASAGVPASSGDASGGGDNNGGGFALDDIAGVDTVRLANSEVARATQLNVEKPESKRVSLQGMSLEFMENNGLKFQQRAEGYATDEDVWRALQNGRNVAIIDAFSVPTGGFGDGGGSSFTVSGIKPTDKTFAPVRTEIRNSATGDTETVDIIGILTIQASGLYNGLYVGQDTFSSVFDTDSTLHYVRLADGADANDAARGIERALLAEGVQAESQRQIIDDYQAQSKGFIYLLQGFMAIGLFVGIAAVGVIAFRTVVERRQQIGMLRAIGYTRRTVAISFLMESSFTALLGIVSGITLGLLLANQLVKTDDFVAGGVDSFYIPWFQIIAVGGFAFLASLIMTIIPSRQASSIPIAEALRYE